LQNSHRDVNTRPVGVELGVEDGAARTLGFGAGVKRLIPCIICVFSDKATQERMRGS
jgi:hypothetical protein